MRTLLSDLLSQLKGIWSRLDGGQRLVVSSVLLATALGLTAMVWFAGQPSYETVFTAVSSDDLTSAQRALDQAGISYRPSGRSLEVDRGDVKAAQTALMGAGVLADAPSGDLGVSSIIDDAETKAWKLANASIARAEDAVRSISGVQNVKITAAPPRKRRAFVDKDRESRPTATVLLLLKSGANFHAVARIASSQTASQLGIPEENVTVADSGSRKRWRYDPSREAGSGSSEFLDLQRKMSEERTARAQGLLDSMWPNRTSVVVNVELDPQWEIVSEKVLPDSKLVSSEETTKDSTETTPATSSRTSTTLSGGGSSVSKDKVRKETTKREYITEIGERRKGMLAPDVRRLTVAVLYDRKLEDAEGFDKSELIKAVKSMVGWDERRDQETAFSVMPAQFEAPNVEELMVTGGGFAEVALKWGPTVGQILGVLVVVFFLRGLFKKSGGKVKAASPESLVRDEPKTEEDVPPEEMQRRMRREIERAISTDPAALAKLLETWLIEQGA